jgi:hypothetical protein
MYINICFILFGFVNSYKINSLFFNHNSCNQNSYNRIAQFNINMREVNTMMKLNESNIFNITDMNELTSQSERDKEILSSFPSFNDYLIKRADEKIKALEEYNKKVEKNKKKFENINPKSKDLKLLNSIITLEWSKNWVYDMISYNTDFGTYTYKDIFLMRDFANEHTENTFFYIGYFPSDMELRNGPFYIAAFELVPIKREFQTHLIIQNPNYLVENDYDEKKIVNFKKELIEMTKEASVIFKFDYLKESSNLRYYYSWFYDLD